MLLSIVMLQYTRLNVLGYSDELNLTSDLYNLVPCQHTGHVMAQSFVCNMHMSLKVVLFFLRAQPYVTDTVF